MSKENPTETLGDRMKAYEAITTSTMLMPHTPVYARIDGRAFHSFCRGFKKPYSTEFGEVMIETCKYLVAETGAILGYVESDEISLGWEDYTKAPFMGRLFKLESTLAAMATSAFTLKAMSLSEDSEVKEATIKKMPTFDCRVFNVPNMHELALSFLFRANDAVKNSITGMALAFFSHKQIQNKKGEEKIRMLAERGYDFWKDTPDWFRDGTFLHRVLVRKHIPADVLEKFKPNTVVYDSDGTPCCLRTEIQKLMLPAGKRLSEIANKEDFLFNNAAAILKDDVQTSLGC